MSDFSFLPHAGPCGPRWLQIDPAFLRRRYADLLGEHAPDALHSDAALLAFMQTQGSERGLVPNALFAEEWYLAQNPDVEGGVRDGIFASGFQHYCESGFRSRAPHWLFSERDYFSRHQDLSPSGLEQQGFANGYDHFLRAGDREGRSAHPYFDPMVFRDDAVASQRGVDLDGGLFTQFLGHAGQTRTSWYFDPVWYLETYPAVGEAIAAGQFANPLHHYLLNDTPQAFDPNPVFSEQAYAERNPDVHAIVQAGGLRSCFEHFRQFGQHEGRELPSVPEFSAWRQRPAVRRAIALGRAADPLSLYLRDRPADLSGHVPVLDEDAQQALALRRAESLLPLLARAPLDFRSLGAPALSVILTARNGFLWTIAALAALRESTGAALDVVLVDGGSTDGTRGIERLALGVRVIRPEQRLSLARRMGLAWSAVRAPVVLFCPQMAQLRPGAVDAALAHFADAAVVAVTGRVVGVDGQVREAGLGAYRDGNLERIGHGQSLFAPEIGAVRHCDAGGAGGLFVRNSALPLPRGFDAEALDFETLLIDLALGLRAQGGVVMYDPAVLVRVIGRSMSDPQARDMARVRRRDRYGAFLRSQPAGAPYMSSRLPGRAARPVDGMHGPKGLMRVLVLCEHLPMPWQGGRAVALLRRIALLRAAGCVVTLYPLEPHTHEAASMARALPADLEVLEGAGPHGLLTLLDRRRLGFERIWIAGVEPLERCLYVFHELAHALPTCGFVLDTLGLRSIEQRGRRRVGGNADPAPLMADLKHELRNAWFCQSIVTDNAEEAALVEQAGFTPVQSLGLPVQEVALPEGGRGFAQRQGIILAPAIRAAGDAAHDGVDWFIHAVLPRLDRLLPPDVLIEIAGYRPDGFDLSPLARYRRVRLLPVGEDLRPALQRGRVFVAAERFSTGMLPEVMQAIECGMPCVLSDEIAARFGLDHERACLNGGLGDVERMAEMVTKLYMDEGLWTGLRDHALVEMRARFGEEALVAAMSGILEHAA